MRRPPSRAAIAHTTNTVARLKIAIDKASAGQEWGCSNAASPESSKVTPTRDTIHKGGERDSLPSEKYSLVRSPI